MQRARIAEQLARVETLPGVERMFAQHAHAEAVDGEDGSEVGFLGSDAQAARQLRRGFTALRELALDQEACQCGFVLLVLARWRADQVGGQGQPLADALAQFLRRGLGIGHRQHLAHAQALFDDQAGEQCGQRVGLAGTGAGLDQLHAIERARQVRLAGRIERAHAPSSGPVPTTAAYTRRLVSMKSCMPAASASGSRPRKASWIASPVLSPQR